MLLGTITMTDALAHHRDKIIPYRMKTTSIMNFALRHVDRWPNVRRMTIYFDDELFIEGLSTGFTNAAIESGVINCRALLEFLGLQVTSQNRLAQRLKPRKESDVGIEHYNLPMVSASDVIAKYPGDAAEAESALVSIITIANKFLSHNTTSVEIEPPQLHLIEIASRGVPALVTSYFYTRLGLPAPDYKIKFRSK